MEFKQVNRKREQKNSLFFREMSSLVQQLSLDEPSLSKVFVTRAKLSNDYKVCYVYFSTYTNKEDFLPALEILKLYKGSLRKAISQSISGKYTADLRFLYDDIKDKERNMNDLLDSVVKDLPEEK